MKNADLQFHWIVVLFCIRVFSGIILKWISDVYYPSNDYAFLQAEAMSEYEWLLTQPKAFLQGIFQSPYENKYGNFYQSDGSYWKDLANNLIIKLQAILNIITRGHSASNILLMNSIGFMGSIAIYRTFITYYPAQKKTLIFSCFLLPTTLYFTSGIHKDLFVFTTLGFFVFIVDRISTMGFSFKRVFLFTITLFSLAVLRNFLLVCILPCLSIYIISTQCKPRSIYPILITMIGIATFMILITCLKPEWSPWKLITERQHAFMELKKANSQLNMFRLENNCASMIENFPAAINHGFFRPYFWDTSNPFAILLGLELYFYWTLVFIYVYQKRVNIFITTSPTMAFSILVSLLMLISIGYIVPNSFSIVRYRSIYLPFLITPLLSCLKWKREI